MIRKKLSIVLLSLVCFSMIGCNKNKSVETVKYVLNNDVTKIQSNKKNKSDIKKNNNTDVKVKNIESLNIYDNERFEPCMFIDNEIYGYVIKNKNNLENYIDDKLYKLNNNKLEKTNLEYNEKGNIYYKNDKIYEIDYSKSDTSFENEKLRERLKECHYVSKDVFLNKYSYDNEKRNFISSLEFLQDGSKIFYLYDEENDKLYQYKKNIKDINFSLEYKYGISNSEYVSALNTFVRLDENFKIYKMNFDGQYFDFQEYLDLSKYTKKKLNKNIDSITIKNINDNEVLIFQYKKIPCISKEYFQNVELVSIDKFNFKTNQFTELMKVDESTHFSPPSIINDLIILDEFDLNENSIKPKNRYFKLLGKKELKNIYKEEIKDEEETISTEVNVIPNMDKKELILYRSISEFENGDNIKFKKNIYKKYMLQ